MATSLRLTRFRLLARNENLLRVYPLSETDTQEVFLLRGKSKVSAEKDSNDQTRTPRFPSGPVSFLLLLKTEALRTVRV